jgi:cytochrome c556
MRWLIAVLAVVALAVAPLGAHAGDYHSGANLVCNDCHVAHYSVSHSWEGGKPAPTLIGGPYGHLLVADNNQLCLTCHNGVANIPDVYGTDFNNGSNDPAKNRIGGGLNAAAGAPGLPAAGGTYAETDGHSLGATTVAPGGSWTPATGGLKCVDCHSQHGQNVAQYRNLQLNTTNSSDKFFGKNVTYAWATYDGTKDVFETIKGGTGDLAAYSEGNIQYNEPDTRASAMGNWCSACHTSFHGQSGATNMGGNPAGGGDTGPLNFPWLRHPTADVNIGQNASFLSSKARFDGRVNRVKVMTPVNGGATSATADAGVTPSCFSCHKSHGNQNAFGLIYMIGDGAPVTEEGDGGQYKDLCRQCHLQGG